MKGRNVDTIFKLSILLTTSNLNKTKLVSTRTFVMYMFDKHLSYLKFITVVKCS